MPKRSIQFAQGNYYHIYNRGAGRHRIFREHTNYMYVIRLLKKIASECNVTIIAYCLIPNHYHLLVRQDGDTPAGKLPTRVFNSYVQAFNKRYGRSGVLFEGRFECILVGTDKYLRNLCRYIHANPVHHVLTDNLDLWPYSNYHECIGQRKGTLYDPTFIEDHFGDAQSYKQFVTDYLQGKAPLPKDLHEYLNEIERNS